MLRTWRCVGLVTAAIGLGIFLLAADALAFGGKKKAEESSSGAATAIRPPETVWVMKSDGSRSCGEKAGITLEIGAAPLHKASIPTLGSRKVHDGKMRTAVCGSATGMMNTYQIERKYLGRAVAAGYDEAPSEMSPKTLESGTAE